MSLIAEHRAALRILVPAAAVLALFLAGCRAGQAPRVAPADLSPPVGIDLPNARLPVEGLLAGGQPTEEHLERAADAGFRTVINLRSAAEESFVDQGDLARELGMRYVHIPIAGADGLTEDVVRQIAEELDRAAGGRVVLHCASGNRVGAVLALKAAWIDGASREEALKLGRSAGLTRLEEKVTSLLEATGD